jgi:hypothetical protein
MVMVISDFEAQETRRAILDELEHVLHGSGFAGSERSSTLLRYLVDHVLKYGPQSIKERTVGVEVFGRDPSYDTGKDAIVRVSATSVRKRLLAHYSRPDYHPAVGAVLIQLAPGSYTPEFVQLDPCAAAPVPVAPPAAPVRRRTDWLKLGAFAAVLALAIACAVLGWQNHEFRTRVAPGPGMDLLPWSEFDPKATVRVVLTDGNYGMYRHYTKREIPLAEYSDERFTFDFNERYPNASSFVRNNLTSTISAMAAVRIASMLQTTGRSAQPVPARRMRMEDFKDDQPTILLGSLIANPWTDLFRESLTFAIELEPGTSAQIVRNHSPLAGESAIYRGQVTRGTSGISYATLSLIPNLTGKGWVMIVAGTSGEGTSAATELLTNPVRLRQELLRRRINPAGHVRRFELLLKVESLASDSRRFEVIASRVMPG